MKFGVMFANVLDFSRPDGAVAIARAAEAAGFESLWLKEDLGVERIVIPPLAFDAAGIHDALARYGDEVIAKLR